MDGTARRARLARSRLYLVLEARPHGEDPSALLDAALRGGVDVVQLRDKELSPDELAGAAEPFRRACDAHGALFVLNDRPELVERCGADGVHVGAEDAPLADARRAVGGERLVGLSATTAEELRGDPDYFGVGAVYGTPTKPESPPGGLGLVRAARDTLRVPWFAIGGVDETNVGELSAAGAAGVAVVRAVRDADDPEVAARALRGALPPTDPVVADGDTEIALPQLDWLEWSLAAGQTGATPHVHAAHTDVFFVLDGELELRLGDETVRVPAGSCAAAPPLLVHGFRNPGSSDARLLNIHARGGWARGRRRFEREAYDTFGVDRGSAAPRGVVSGPGDGDRLAKEHRLALVKLHAPDLDVLEYAVSPEYDGAGEHVHLRHADCFHVLEGALELTLDGESVRAERGTTVVVPPGVPHAFTSAGRARFLNVHAPSCDFVEYLRRLDAGEELDETRYDSFSL
ncbi:MAG TPA: thiamine phosphate synthase [Gaiellaceae bacterium]|nr:thiamine phosphate synthase [Gaiellaceae bacterium]